MSVDAMKQALAVLEEIADEVSSPYDNKLGDAILALRAAIEQTKKPHRWQRLTEEEIARREQVDPIRVRIMQEAYDLADRNDSEGYNSVKVMCSEVLSMIDRLLDEPVYEANEAFGKRQEWWNDKMFELEAELQRYKKSAAMWRNKAYEAAGHPLPWKPDELWQGLTDEDLDIRALWDVLAGMKNADGSIVVQFARAIEAKLKEKNG